MTSLLITKCRRFCRIALFFNFASEIAVSRFVLDSDRLSGKRSIIRMEEGWFGRWGDVRRNWELFICTNCDKSNNGRCRKQVNQLTIN